SQISPKQLRIILIRCVLHDLAPHHEQPVAINDPKSKCHAHECVHSGWMVFWLESRRSAQKPISLAARPLDSGTIFAMQEIIMDRQSWLRNTDDLVPRDPVGGETGINRFHHRQPNIG